MIENDLKPRRKFTQWVRDGLWLMFSLSRGDLSALVELFPAVVERIKREAVEEAGPGVTYEQLQQLFAQVTTQPVSVAKPLEAPTIQARDVDTVDDNAVQNFLNAFNA